MNNDPEQANESIDAAIPTERTDEHFVERHATFLNHIQTKPIGLLFLGDSITRRWVDVLELWHHYFAPYQPANFGVGGDAVQNLLWRVQNGQIDGIKPRVIVLFIGTNNVPTNTSSETAAAIGKVIDVIQSKLPQTKILLLAIFPRGPQTPDRADAQNPYYMDIVTAANKELAALDNGDTVRFLDLGPLFISSDGNINTDIMTDQLHLIEPGYKIWGEAMADLLEEMMRA
jgi:beta-glucosidase